MTRELHDPPFGSPAPLARAISADIERAMLQLVVDGFERWRLEGFTRIGDYEDHYTVRLVAYMKEIRRERNLAFLPMFRYVEASDEMFQGRADPAHAPCIDIVIASDILSDDPYLSIECKRLAADDLAPPLRHVRYGEVCQGILRCQSASWRHGWLHRPGCSRQSTKARELSGNQGS